MTQQHEPEDPLVELDPLVHRAELDVGDHVVDVLEADALRDRVGARTEVGRRPHHGRILDQRVDGVAVGGDHGLIDLAPIPLQDVWLDETGRPTLERQCVGAVGVGHGDCDITHPRAVEQEMAADLVVGIERCREDEPDVTLLEGV